MRIVQEHAPPPELPQEARERVGQSFKWWSLRYGSSHDGIDHIAAYFGAIHLSVGQAMLWAFVTPAGRRLSRGQLREGARLWSEFLRGAPWRLLAFCGLSERREARFLLWLGFERISTDVQYQYFAREPDGN